MSKEVVCPTCQKKYTVGPEMAGHRVRCRQCANVFTVTGAVVPPVAAGARFEPDEDMAPPPPNPFMDTESQFESALNRESKHSKLRPSTPFKFPRAAQLDDFLPWTLVAVGFLWVIWETFHSGDIGTVWGGLIRVAVVDALYVGLVVPLALMGIRKISLKLGYALPPQPWLRTAAVFALPATLGYVTWVALVSPISFAIGALLGLIFAAGAFWFLFRVDPQKELAPSFGAAAGAFAGSLVACGLVMWVLNMVLLGSLKNSQAINAVHVSPIGPSFAWKVDGPPVQRNAANTSESDDSTTVPDRSTQANRNKLAGADDNGKTQMPMPANFQSNSKAAQSANPTAASEAPLHVVQSDPIPVVEPKPAPQGAAGSAVASAHTSGSGNVFDLPPDDVTHTPHATAPEANVAAADSRLVSDLKKRQLPFVRDVRSPQDLGTFDELVYPATASSWFAVVRHKDLSQDSVELRNSSTFERTATVLFPRETKTEMGSHHYALSPDGQLMVRPSTFPKSCFQVWSFKEQRVTRRADMADDTSMPELLGFIDNDHFVVQCLFRAGKALQVRDAKSGLAQHTIPLPPYAHTPGNGEMSPDGKYFALATRIKGQAEVLLIDLNHLNTNPRALQINGLGDRWPVEPVGISFSRDSSRIAAMFSNQGEAYVVSWNARDGRVLTDQVCPGLAPPAAQAGGPAECGRAFDWVGNNALLVGGSSVVDPSTGRLLANLADAPLKSQHLEDGNVFHLEYADQGHSRLAVVDLDPAQLEAYSKRVTP